MAKQQVYYLENGATVIYQKQSSFNGYSLAVGFRCGSQLDGEKKGLAHCLEHMLCKPKTKGEAKNLFDNILKYTINQNAFTTKNCICVSSFSAVDKNIQQAIDLTKKMLTTTTFSEKQLKNEIEVIKHEIRLYENENYNVEHSAVELLIDNLKVVNEDKNINENILGTSKTLNALTPKDLTDYTKKYFNLENMVISITTNKPVEKAMEYVEQLTSVVKPAKSEKYIVEPPIPMTYKNLNGLVALPMNDVSTTSVCLLLKERNRYAQDIHLEYAYDIMEEYLLNNFGGILWNSLREDNQLVYSFSMSNLDLLTAKFKMFSALTNSTKMRKTILEFCKVIRNIGQNGITKKQFDTIKTVLTDINTANLNKYKNASAYSNFIDYIENIPYIDYKLIDENIAKMTYENFNEHLKSIYSMANVSVAVEGNFDSRKLYNIIEIEKMLGKNVNEGLMSNLNLPKVEMVEATEKQEYSLNEQILNIISETANECNNLKQKKKTQNNTKKEKNDNLSKENKNNKELTK